MIGTKMLSKVGKITNNSQILLGLITYVLYFLRFSIIFLILHIWSFFDLLKLGVPYLSFFCQIGTSTIIEKQSKVQKTQRIYKMRINIRIFKKNCIIYYILSYYYTDSEITNMAKYCEMFGIFLTKFSSIFEILNLIT